MRVFAQIELCKKRATENCTNKAALGQIVLVDQDIDIPKELCEYVDDSKSPLILNVSYSPTDWEIVYELGPFNASSKGAIKSVRVFSIFTRFFTIATVYYYFRRVCISARSTCCTS